jgi:carbamoyl-phosphate synthase/aspartate carbamoyltransferase/dihydroorotase
MAPVYAYETIGCVPDTCLPRGNRLTAGVFFAKHREPKGSRFLYAEGSMLRFPGLIDPHVHMREPGTTHKEDFDYGTAAALAGGYAAVLTMPNTQPPICDHEALQLGGRAARSKARCDYGIYLGAGEADAKAAAALAPRACGLKMYLDQTCEPLRLVNMGRIRAYVAAWPANCPLAVHAEGRGMAMMILFASAYDRPAHICQISLNSEVLLIRMAKQAGLPVTYEVTPQHLFLSQEDMPRLGEGRAEVRPRLAAKADVEALWEDLDVIDCFATDHAPHTVVEKDSQNPPPGFPGPETSLGLLLQAVHEGRLGHEAIIERCYTNPRRIFGLPEQRETYVEVDPDEEWEVRGAELQSRCGWTPFEGMCLRGRVRNVVLRGRPAFADGRVLSERGAGEDLAPAFHDEIGSL